MSARGHQPVRIRGPQKNLRNRLPITRDRRRLKRTCNGYQRTSTCHPRQALDAVWKCWQRPLRWGVPQSLHLVSFAASKLVQHELNQQTAQDYLKHRLQHPGWRCRDRHGKFLASCWTFMSLCKVSSDGREAQWPAVVVVHWKEQGTVDKYVLRALQWDPWRRSRGGIKSEHWKRWWRKLFCSQRTHEVAVLDDDKERGMF